LVETISGKKLSRNEEPLDINILAEHIATAFAVYEAVYLRKPLYERAITVGGPCILEPKNVWAPIGTKALDLIRFCKGLMREPERIIFGGPMTGEAISSLEEPITKKVQGLLALPKDVVKMGSEEPCIRCGLCVHVCPESLIPETLIRAVRKDNQSLAQEFQVDSCTECGACAYVCPSQIPMVSIIRTGKSVPFGKVSKPEPDYALSSQG
jgi:electron transport complex protein RnfC